MNINVNETLKSFKTKPSSRNEKKDDKGGDFAKTFNKLLDKKASKDKKSIKDKQVSPKEVNDTEDSKETSNIYPQVSFYPVEETLNNKFSLEDINNFSELTNGEVKILLSEDITSQDNLRSNFEAELQNLGTAEEEVDNHWQLDTEIDTDFKFSIEQAKANLTKSLNSHSNGIDIKGTDYMKEDIDLENKLSSEAQSYDKLDLILKEGLIGKEKDEKSLENIKESKNAISTDEKDIKINTQSLNEVEEDTLDLGSLKPKLEGKDVEKTFKQFIEEKTTVEEAKPFDTNALFNRIQNSMIGLEEANDAVLPQNIKNIEESMIKFMKVSKDGDASVMKVKLYPEELGSIDIHLKLDKGKLIADIVVASDKIKEMFLNSTTVLNRNLVEQNIQVKNINIYVNDNTNGFESFSGETTDGEARGNGRQSTNANNNARKGLNNSSVDNMRINNINNRSKGLDILV